MTEQVMPYCYKEREMAKEWKNLEQKSDKPNAQWNFQRDSLQNSIDNFSTYQHWLKEYLAQGAKNFGYTLLTLIFAYLSDMSFLLCLEHFGE